MQQVVPTKAHRASGKFLIATAALIISVLAPAKKSDAACALLPVVILDGSDDLFSFGTIQDTSGNTLFRVSDTGSNGGGSFQVQHTLRADSCVFDVDVNNYTITIDSMGQVLGTMSEAINFESAAFGGTVIVNGTLSGGGGSPVAFVGGTSSETLIINSGGLVVGDVIFGNGADTFVLNAGGVFSGGLDMGPGVDSAVINSSAWAAIGGSTFDGGGDNDFVTFVTDMGNTVPFGSGAFNTEFLNFENLIKDGPGTLILTDETFQTVTVADGLLSLLGTVDITGGTTNVMAGAQLDIGDMGSTPTTVNESGDTTVSGVVKVFDAAVFNAGDAGGDLVTVNAGGTLAILTGGTLNAASGVNILGTINVAGSMTVAGTTQNISGILNVDGGMFSTSSNTLNNSILEVSNGGTYMSSGSVTNNSFLTVASGASFTAASGTTNNSVLQVKDFMTQYLSSGPLMNPAVLQVFNGASFDSFNTTTNNGLLEVFDPNSSFFANGDVMNFGTLNVRLAGTFTAQNATVNNGTIAISQSGTYNALGLLTTNTLIRITSNGTLNVPGGVIVGGGVVEGNGQIVAPCCFNNQNGTVRPGIGPGDTDTLSVVGQYNQGPNGNLEVEIAPNGDSDLLAVMGDANLGGALTIVGLADGFTPGQTFTVLTTTGSTNGTFSSVNLGGLGLDPFIVNIVYNSVSFQLASSPSALLAMADLNQNQTATLKDLDENVSGMVMPGTLDEVAFQLGLLPVSIIPAALDQLHSEPYDAYTEPMQRNFWNVNGALAARMRMLRCVSGGGGAPGCNGGMTLSASTEGASGIVTPNGFAPAIEPGMINLWATGLGTYGRKDRTREHLGYDYRTGGVLLGGDWALSEHFVLGLMVGGTLTDIDFIGRTGEGEAEGVAGGLYAGYFRDRWFAHANLTYGGNWYETRRPINIGTVRTEARSSSTGRQLGAHGTVGYVMTLGGFTLEPSAGLSYVLLNQDRVTETGAGPLNLRIGERDISSLRGHISFRLARPFALSETKVLVPELRVGYAHEFLDDDRELTTRFAGATTQFRIRGDDPARNIATFGAGLAFKMSQGLTAFVEYNGEYSGERMTHGGSLGLRIHW